MYAHLWGLIAPYLHANQFASGGMVLMALGALGAYLRNSPARIVNWTGRQFSIVVTVTNDDELYERVCLWLSRQPYAQRVRTLTAKLAPTSGGAVPIRAIGDNTPEPEREPILIPAPGQHFFRAYGKLIWLGREQPGQTPTAFGSEGLSRLFPPREILTLRLPGRNQTAARNLLKCILEETKPQGREAIRCYSNANWGDWQGKDLRSRALSSVILPGEDAEWIRQDVAEFLAGEDRYHHLGVPHRRGYLLYGQAGAGKSSLVLALASEFRRDLYVLSLTGEDTTDQVLSRLMMNIPAGSFLLIEDVDAAFHQRKSEESKGITFSGLLNALDGVAAVEGRVLFMTTNFVDRLDPALIRPGRVDARMEFVKATEDQAERLYARFHPEALPCETERFGREVAGRCTMAELQEQLMRDREIRSEACERVPE